MHQTSAGLALKRTSSESDIGEMSPKRIKSLTPIVDKEFIDCTRDKFLKEADLFRDSLPRDAALKLWLYSYSVDESRCLSKETYDTYMDEVIQFIKTFKDFNLEDLENSGQRFGTKRTHSGTDDTSAKRIRI
uniref:Uncharacterized protein n=1 Tax=Meloidogyne javanica TaxID=6303 RepID=A0A915MPE9_MELJA